MYLFGLPLLCLGSIGVARSRTISQLMVFRFIQALGTSGGMAVGTMIQFKEVFFLRHILRCWSHW